LLDGILLCYDDILNDELIRALNILLNHKKCTILINSVTYEKNMFNSLIKSILDNWKKNNIVKIWSFDNNSNADITINIDEYLKYYTSINNRILSTKINNYLHNIQMKKSTRSFLGLNANILDYKYEFLDVVIASLLGANSLMYYNCETSFWSAKTLFKLRKTHDSPLQLENNIVILSEMKRENIEASIMSLKITSDCIYFKDLFDEIINKKIDTFYSIILKGYTI